MTLPQDVRAAGGRVARVAKRRVDRAVTTYRQRSSRSVASESGDGQNLVPDPVFVLCSPRSGSTLVRAILDSHSQIHAPHELHFRSAEVRATQAYASSAWAALGFTPRDMESILWDRMLHLLLAQSGKSIIVEKTPQNVLDWTRIAQHWPQARYVHLRRHPLRIVESRARARPDQTIDFQVQRTAVYCAKLDEASADLPGPIVRYEDLTADPARELQRICTYLGVDFEPAMLSYRQDDFRIGLGDWTGKIKSGRIQPSTPAPPLDEVPVDLRGVTTSWGYR